MAGSHTDSLFTRGFYGRKELLVAKQMEGFSVIPYLVLIRFVCYSECVIHMDIHNIVNMFFPIGVAIGGRSPARAARHLSSSDYD